MHSPAVARAARQAPNHPALRWTPRWRPDVRGQHRRVANDETACGLAGPLVLAEATDVRCAACYPVQ